MDSNARCYFGYMRSCFCRAELNSGIKLDKSTAEVRRLNQTTVEALVSGHPRDAKKVSVTGAGRLREWFS